MDENSEPEEDDPKRLNQRSGNLFQKPYWIPEWMGENERAAFILAIAIVLAAGMICLTMLTVFDGIKHRL